MQATTASALKILFLMVIPTVFCTAVWAGKGERSSAPSRGFTDGQNTEELIFTIHDNGCGIAKEDSQKVFELFRRAGKQDVPGDGMGLTYVKTLVKRLGCRIWCETELGKGTAFNFTIPKRPAPAGAVMDLKHA